VFRALTTVKADLAQTEFVRFLAMRSQGNRENGWKPARSATLECVGTDRTTQRTTHPREVQTQCAAMEHARASRLGQSPAQPIVRRRL
jgi:hypothetical protein